ncbi:D-alanyl-D-alanine carboxypeptidase [Streptomyces sp. NPDC050418]|uniref:D-alanyl-D-alanine carboxypeptidase n=1 Tax=Streptomyces sp. NPDC050418 TaxID=3365612 RepID=UPI0037A54E7A
MAGETPDRAQQGKTSDANGSVEPKGPAPSEERAADPRIAVSRPRASEPKADQATAVFSTAALRGVAGGEAEGSASGAASGSGAGAASGSGSGEDSDAASDDAADAAAVADTGRESGESGEPAESAEPGASGDSDGDARLRAAVAAWVAGGADSGASEGEPDAEAASGAEDEGEAETEAEPEPEPETEVEAEADVETEPAPDAEPADEVEGEDEVEPEAEAEPAAPAADTEPEAASEPDPDPDPEPADADEPEPDAEDAPTAADAKSDDAAGEDTDGTDGTDGTDDADAEPPVDQATAVFKAVPPPVDQPTAMFRTVRPDAKSDAPSDAKPDVADVKQDAKADAEPDAKAGGDGEAESSAERTSTFVALKPLEPKSAPKAEPKPAPKAEPKAPAAPAAPEQPAPTPVNAGPERTAQQPLPPKAPIDLLAELTNRPPPAETPMRTVGRRIKIWTPLLLLLAIVFAVAQAVRPLPTPKLTLTAQQTVSFEGDKPQIPWPDQGQAALDVEGIGSFGTYGDQKPVPIASIAKVMTAYVILKEHPLKGDDKGPMITVDKEAEDHYVSGKKDLESVVDVKEGEKLSEYEAIQAIMLPSANNVARLLARWDSDGDEKAFVQKMNDAAAELGMKNTTYTDPSGLDKTTVSTAEDLVKLGRAAMEIPVFKQISGQGSYKPGNGRGDPARGDGSLWYNFNNLVPTVAVGIKTGTTTAAGGNLLFASSKTIDGKEQIVIGAALAQFAKHTNANIDEVTANSRKLMDAAEAALESKTVVKKGDVVGHVDDGLGGTTPVVATKDVKAVGWSGLTVELGLQAEKTMPHKAKAGTEVGVLTVGDGKGEAVSVPVALQSDLEEPGFGAKLTRIM